MAGVTSVFQGLVVMMVGILIGVVLNYAILIPMSELQSGLTAGGVYEVTSEWDSRHNVDFLVTLTHLTVYAVPILSILYFVVTIVKSLRYEAREGEEFHGGRY